MVEERGGVVEHITVELAERNNELEGVAERVIDGDEIGGDEGAGAPKDLEEGDESWMRNKGGNRVNVRQ